MRASKGAITLDDVTTSPGAATESARPKAVAGRRRAVPAAAVAVLRSGAAGTEVLLVRRNRGSAFGGAWAFPGGAIESIDRARFGLPAAVAARAAARELAEETGVIAAPNELEALIGPMVTDDADRRFTVRFFTFRAQRPVDVQLNVAELSAHRWLSPAQALRRAGALGVPPATRAALDVLAGTERVAKSSRKTVGGRRARPNNRESAAGVPRQPARCATRRPEACAGWSPAEEMAWLCTELAAEIEPVVAAALLLRYCRDHHSELWEHAGDRAAVAAVTKALTPLFVALPGPAVVATLTAEVRAELSAAFDGRAGRVPPAVLAHGLAEFLDDRYAASFGHWFRRRSPYRPEFGDPVPLDDPGLASDAATPLTSPPWRLANRLDETRHLRLASGWTSQFDVVFDYSLAGNLAGLLRNGERVATCHPNVGLGEFALTSRRGGRLFPVRPADHDAQHARLDALIGAAARDGAAVIVLPELSVTPALASRLRRWVERDDGPRLLVAGSSHVTDRHRGGAPGRHNVAVTWARGYDEPIEYFKHSPADRPLLEDIQPEAHPELHIYVVDGWHLVVAICRDLLNPEAIHTLVSAGANLVLVPAMSETLLPFGGQIAHLVGSCQTVAAIANGPMEWPRLNGQPATAPPALFGHPRIPQQTVTVSPPAAETGYALFDVRTAEATWKPLP